MKKHLKRNWTVYTIGAFGGLISLEKLEKNKSNIIKLYPQLTMKDETTEPLLIMRNPDKDIV